MDTTESHLLARLFWSPDPNVQSLALLVLAAGFVAIAAVYIPLIVRLARITVLQRSLMSAANAENEPLKRRRESMNVSFQSSPLVGQWQEFQRRWRAAHAAGAERTSGGGVERSAVRLMDVFDERPLVPPGLQCSLLSGAPPLLFGLGVFGGVAGLAANGSGAGVAAALPAVIWGLALGLTTALASRLIEGRFGYHGLCLDLLAQRAYGALSESELSTRAVYAQRDTIERLHDELRNNSQEIARSLDEGLKRIEVSTAQAASLVSEEQRGSLRGVVEELRTAVRRGVDTHLGSLNDVLERTVQHQDDVSKSIERGYERMLETAESNDRVAQTLDRAATAVDEAATSMKSTASDIEPMLDSLRATGGSLEQAAGHIQSTQQVAASSVDSVRVALESAASAMGEQRQLIDKGLGDIRGTVEQLSIGLGDGLTNALGEIDRLLGGAVDRVRETINETSQVVDRLGEPIRAAETSNRETHAALERVRIDVGSVSQWLIQAVEPVRTTLAHLDDNTQSISRGLVDFTHRADAFEKVLDGLRATIGQGDSGFQNASGELGARLERAIEALEALTTSTGTAADRIADASRLAAVSPIAGSPGAPIVSDPVVPPSQQVTEVAADAAPSDELVATADDAPAATEVAARGPSAGGFKKLGADPWARLERERHQPDPAETGEVTLGDNPEPRVGLGGSLLKGSPPANAEEARPEEDAEIDGPSTSLEKTQIHNVAAPDITYRQAKKKD